MADIRCPMCGKPNPSELDVCQFCGARLKPLISASPDNTPPIKAGEKPVLKGTAEFDKVKTPQSGSIHPGEAPTKKNTAELERALPSWLRSLRGDKDEGEAESGESKTPAEELSLPGSTEPAADAPIESGDWLAGLNKASAEEEEAVPDWLAGLRGEKEADSAAGQGFESETGPELGSSDWMSRLEAGSPPAGTAPKVEPPPAAEPAPGAPAESEPPAWLKNLSAFEPGPAEPPAPAAEPAKFPEWVSRLPDIPEANAAEPPRSAESGEPAVPAEHVPDWLNKLQEQSGELEAEAPAQAPAGAAPAEKLPDWLAQAQEKGPFTTPPFEGTEGGEPPAGEKLPDWLDQFQDRSILPEETAAAAKESVPDWLSNLQPPSEMPQQASEEKTPEWLSNLEAQEGTGGEVPPALIPEEASEAQTFPQETPAWLSQLQDAGPAEGVEPPQGLNEVFSEAAAPEKAAEPLPDWLANVEPAAEAPAETPAFIEAGEAAPFTEPAEKAFSMETPDWLSKLKPEQGAEKGAAPAEAQPAGSGIEAAALPSWVQAMRPLESVVDATKNALPEEEQVTEQSGPLAGLVGVLPAGPGLGMSRKPPAYSIKLQVSNAQQRYITNLEKLIANETQASAVKTERKQSNRLWRWVTAAILIFMAGIPFIFTKMQATPPPALVPSDRNAASNIISNLPANAPVLIAFDYSPALSGELEAVAATLVDPLQSKNARLAFVSTSPTGPALAERFIRSTLLVNSHQYKSGEQYVNLGYLSGGPAGIFYFASAPAAAMPVTTGGQSAWSMPPLSGVSQLSDFAAVLILTDDADSGRNWIEQSGRALGNTPMLMVISAQSEPMVRPYFDSGQLKALVSGLPDAKKYEQKNNRPGLAAHYWDSFSLATFAAELIIVIGAAWNALLSWRDRLHRPKEKA